MLPNTLPFFKGRETTNVGKNVCFRYILTIIFF